MRFFIGNNLSPFLTGMLEAAGHDGIHARDLGLRAARPGPGRH